MAFVLDCSATMSWVFPDEATEETDRLRDSLIAGRAFVPARKRALAAAGIAGVVVSNAGFPCTTPCIWSWQCECGCLWPPWTALWRPPGSRGWWKFRRRGRPTPSIRDLRHLRKLDKQPFAWAATTSTSLSTIG